MKQVLTSASTDDIKRGKLCYLLFKVVICFIFKLADTTALMLWLNFLKKEFESGEVGVVCHFEEIVSLLVLLFSL